MMTLETQPYHEQDALWPPTGRHILAQLDETSVVVYQAYRPAIGRFAAEHGRFGGEFRFGRMSWIKPSFLWMMYRSGWGTKEGQEVTLAVRIERAGFDALLAQAVHSSFVEPVYGTREAWQAAVASSEVRLQWDPDHRPGGAPCERRAIQLGLRGETLRAYATDWIVEIEDISASVAEQRANVTKLDRLVTPRERVYPVADPTVAARLGLDTPTF